MRITIRPAKLEEWPIIQKLNHEVMADSFLYDPYINVNDPFTESGIAYFKEKIASQEVCSIIAFDNDKPVGYLIGSESEINYRTVKMAEIENMGVTPDYRSKGIGTQLIQAFRTWAKEKNFDTIYVLTNYKSEKAIRFYQKQGLMPIGIELEGKV